MKPLRTLACALIGLLLLSPQVVPAVTIIQPGAADIYDPDEPYEIPGPHNIDKGEVTLSPDSVTLLPRGGTAGLNSLLASFKGVGWHFTPAGKDLAGSFNVSVYDAISPSTEPSAVGSDFVMDYMAGTGDPTGVQFHWIQRVSNNHSILTGEHGDFDDAIDATRTQPLTDPGRLF